MIKEVLDGAAGNTSCLTWGPLCQTFCSAQTSLVEALPPSSLQHLRLRINRMGPLSATAWNLLCQDFILAFIHSFICLAID